MTTTGPLYNDPITQMLVKDTLSVFKQTCDWPISKGEAGFAADAILLNNPVLYPKSWGKDWIIDIIERPRQTQLIVAASLCLFEMERLEQVINDQISEISYDTYGQLGAFIRANIKQYAATVKAINEYIAAKPVSAHDN